MDEEINSKQRLDQMERMLDRFIQFVGESLSELTRQASRSASAQETTEQRLQELIEVIARRAKRLGE